jgi:hypothetical protein
MTLLEEIQSKCSAEMIALGNFHDIAAVVSAGRKAVGSRMISERGVRSALGAVAGSKFLRLLKELSTSEQAPAWLTAVLNVMGVPANDQVFYLETLACAYDWVRSTDGLDIGDHTTRQFLDLIAAGNPDLAAACATLKGMAERPEPVTWDQCQAAVLFGA